MNKYDEVLEYIKSKQDEYTNDIEHNKEYHIFCRLHQMYRELEQVSLSYEKVINEDFKKDMIRWCQVARQDLYNAKGYQSTKQDLLNHINYAIRDLDNVLNLEKVGDK